MCITSKIYDLRENPWILERFIRLGVRCFDSRVIYKHLSFGICGLKTSQIPKIQFIFQIPSLGLVSRWNKRTRLCVNRMSFCMFTKNQCWTRLLIKYDKMPSDLTTRGVSREKKSLILFTLMALVVFSKVWKALIQIVQIAKIYVYIFQCSLHKFVSCWSQTLFQKFQLNYSARELSLVEHENGAWIVLVHAKFAFITKCN